MTSKRTIKSLCFVLIQEGEWWSAQCVEYDIATQAHTFSGLISEIAHQLIAHAALAGKGNVDVFHGLKPAPQVFHDLLHADARREALEPWEVWIEKLYELLNDPLKSQTERLIEAEQMVRGWRVPKIREAHWKEYCRQRASEGA